MTTTIASVTSWPFGLATHPSVTFSDGAHLAVYYDGAHLSYSKSTDGGVTWSAGVSIASINVSTSQIHFDLCQSGDTVYGAAMHWTGTVWQAQPFKLAYATGVVTVTTATAFTIANFSPGVGNPAAGGTELTVAWDADHTLYHLGVRTTAGLVLYALTTALATSFSLTTGGPVATSHNQATIYVPTGGASGTLWQATDGNSGGYPLTVNSVSVSATAYGTWSAQTVVTNTRATTTGIFATLDTTGATAQPLFAWSDGSGTLVATYSGTTWTANRIVSSGNDFGAAVQCVGGDLWVTFISSGLRLAKRVSGVWGSPTLIDSNGDRSGWTAVNQSTGTLVLLYTNGSGTAVYAAAYTLTTSGGGGGGGGPTAGAGMSVTIGGVSVVLLDGTLTGDSAVAQRSNLQFSVIDVNAAWAFTEGQPVILYDGTGAVIMRRWLATAQRGRVSQSGVVVHVVTCVDHHYLADKRLVATTYANQTAGFIVNDLIANFLAAEGVVAGTVATGPTIGSFISNYATVSACLDAICQKAQGYTWWIDEGRRLFFVTSSPTPAPITITDALFERDTESVTHGNALYRNTQYLVGGTAQTSSQTETRQGDGKTTAFVMGYALSTTPTITLNGVAQTVGVGPQGQVSSGKQWYWNQGSNIITQDSGGTKLVSTDTLSVTYVGLYPIVTKAADNAGITTRAAREGGSTSGIVESVATDTTLSTTADAFQAASGFLARYSQDSHTLTFVTQQSGFAQGQLATVNVAAYGLNNLQMLIESVALSDTGPTNAEVGTLYYTVKCVQGPLNTSWVQFFAALASQTQTFIDSINLGSNTTVSILASIAATLDLKASLTPTVYACPLFPWTLPVTLC